MPEGEEIAIEEKQLEETTPEDETANWKTYRNGKYGYEIKYPPGWMVMTDSALVQLPDIELRKQNKER